MDDVVATNTSLEDRVVSFIRKRDFRVKRELGKGACGMTVLLRDEEIDELFVCKKFEPMSGLNRSELWDNFLREIKLLYRLHHENIVRVFHHYIYSEDMAGFILMEFVDGVEIAEYVKAHPERINELFRQSVSGFTYLQQQSILHRDIRPRNLLVRPDGTLKIIDLGFGKHVQTIDDFDKSISLATWCDVPKEFREPRYDFGTEVYFVGQLFRQLIDDNSISCFEYESILERMCNRDPNKRCKGFADVKKAMGNERFVEIDFEENELLAYRNFSDTIFGQLSRVDNDIRYEVDPAQFSKNLQDAYVKVAMEEFVPDSKLVLRCLVSGRYYYRKGSSIPVEELREFLRVFSGVSEEKKHYILANLYTKLDTVPRIEVLDIPEDDIPF